MEALHLLLNRRSQAKLVSPAPSGHALMNIIQSGLRAPDHGGLQPWEFIICKDQGIHNLGAIFKASAIENHKPDREIERAVELPLRAPMVIVAIMRFKQHDKVPRVEQIASAACTVLAMQMAAQAQGFDGIWRTGVYAHCTSVKKALKVEEQDEIMGFLYLGTAKDEPVPAPQRDAETFISYL